MACKPASADDGRPRWVNKQHLCLHIAHVSVNLVHLITGLWVAAFRLETCDFDSMANLRSQVNALVRKNAVYQRRNWVANGCLVLAPVVICVLLVLIQALVNNQLDKPENKCGCKCLSCCKDVDTCTTDSKGVEECTTRQECWDDEAQCLPGMYDDCRQQDDNQCGIEYSSEEQAAFCGIAHPTIYPTFQLIPEPGARGSAASSPGGGVQALASGDPLPIFLTGSNSQLSQDLFNLMYASPSAEQVASLGAGLTAAAATNDLGKAVSDAGLTFGTPKDIFGSYLVDPALLGEELYALATDCADVPEIGGNVNVADVASIRVNITCTHVAASLQPDAAAINSKLYCGWKDSRCEGIRQTNGFASPIDFKDTSATKLSFNYWTNYTATIGDNQPSTIMRANQVMGLVYSAFLKWATGAASGGVPRYTTALVGIADFPTVSRKLTLDFSSLLGPLFYTWLLMMLLPIMIVQLVYEKQNHLRSMMKMHGLSEVTYWLVMCSWYLVLHLIFVALILIVGSAVNLKFFTLNSYGVQVVFYLIFTLNQISLACLASTVYTNARTAVVSTFVYVFGTGLVANLLIDQFYASNKWFNTLLYLFPPFNLYRGMWEFGEYSFRAAYVNGTGITFGRFSDTDNDMWQVLLIFALQAPLFLLLAWYFSAVLPGNGVRRHWLFFLPGHSSRRRHVEHAGKDTQVVDVAHASKNIADGPAGDGAVLSSRNLSSSYRYSASARWKLDADADVEREAEAAMAADPSVTPIVLRNIRKVYPPRDGQPEKAALNGVSLTVKRGECFGLLGPNGAGKSTCINVMVGLQESSGGEVYIAGHDLSEGKTDVYKSMGVCPQDNLLWDNLTGREHLSFYGRLKGLEGAELKQAVDAALASVQLTAAGNKRSKTYSGGMKRRLSVAISLMGRPQVAYLDEPSTGLDPASRHALWTAVKSVKQDYAIILTTHSMQEAEVLCDRLGIIVNGRLICIGNPRELTAAYGNYLEFSITVPPSQVDEATAFVKTLCPSAVCTYMLAGTLRFELPTGQVNVHDVFQAMHDVEARRQLTVLDWGLANATLEEVFIKVARHVSATSTD